MKKNNVQNPVANIAAFSVLAVIWLTVRRMIKKYHKNAEIFY